VEEHNWVQYNYIKDGEQGDDETSDFGKHPARLQTNRLYMKIKGPKGPHPQNLTGPGD